NADGTLDTSFSYTLPTGNVFIHNVEIFPTGRIAISGDGIGTSVAVGWSGLVKMLNPDGTQIPGFYVQKAGQQRVRKITVQSDGKIYIAGEFPIVNGAERRSLARLNANGTLDTTFVPFFSGAQIIHQVLVQSDGKVLVSFSNSFVLVRLNADGSRDTSFAPPFSSSAVIYDMALQPDGRVLVVGEFTVLNGPPQFARLNLNGSVDSSFAHGLPNGRVLRVLVQPDGKSIICGEFTQIGTANRGRIARFNVDGSLDETFNPAGGANGNVYDIDLQTDGKIVLGGTFSTLNGNAQADKIGRLNADGSFDTSFAQSVNTTVQTVKVQTDGKVLIGGLIANVGGGLREKLARLNANGSLDLTFNASANALVFDINLQSDGKILVAGDFITVNNITKLSIARLNNSVPQPKLFDYDGDGKADVSVFRPSENRWYIFRSSDGQISQTAFAISGDVPVPADFDGDGKTDI
nr:FG-GAP-like repeat-containing protein [Pyrinomonadaceae bacterium]